LHYRTIRPTSICRPDGNTIAISSVEGCSITFIDVARRRAFPPLRTTGEIGLVRFQPLHDAARAQSDSRQLIAANVSQRMLSIFDVPRRRLIVNLPLAVRPDHLCFNADGGQVFVTGEGMDAVVVVYPYYTPQIGQTVLAGPGPGAMAASASPGYLFVANPKSADVSILDIETSKVLAVTPVGTQALVHCDHARRSVRAGAEPGLGRYGGDSHQKRESARLIGKRARYFMLIPVGSKPVSAAIVPV
jgi:YVTN family beta-propeller protein